MLEKKKQGSKGKKKKKEEEGIELTAQRYGVFEGVETDQSGVIRAILIASVKSHNYVSTPLPPVIRKVVLSGSARSEVVILVVFFDREPAPAQWSTCMFTLLLFELALKKDPREIRSWRQVQVRPTISQITASNYPTARKL